MVAGEGLAGFARVSESAFGTFVPQVGVGESECSVKSNGFLSMEKGVQSTAEYFVADASAQIPSSCPECGSSNVWRDGLRGEVQRWLCRGCGFRFSQKPVSDGKEQALNTGSNVPLERQICVSETKNLEPATEIKPVAGDMEKALKKKIGFGRKNSSVSCEVRALVAVYEGWLEKEGYSGESHYPNDVLRLAGLGADLHDPESVKVAIGRLKVRDGTKLQYVYAYDCLAKMLKVQWMKPRYKQEEIIPFVPDESELDQLVASCRSRRMAAYLQCLKETFADPGEALRIEWRDISGNVVSINHPVKDHLPRQLDVSNKLVAMLNCLPKESARVFPTTYGTMFSCYSLVRKRMAEVQKNPRFLEIELRSFRHWGGTWLAYITGGNVLVVQKKLGHRRIENTMKYIGMVHFTSSEFETASTATVEEDRKVMSAGFQFVTERSGIKLWQRPKRFGAFQNLEDKRRDDRINFYSPVGGDVSRSDPGRVSPSFSSSVGRLFWRVVVEPNLNVCGGCVAYLRFSKPSPFSSEIGAAHPSPAEEVFL